MALSMNSSTERAFLRAREILRKEGALTSAECNELEELFDEVSGTQFMALTQDPEHSRALREYDRHTRRPAMPILITMVVLLIFSIAMGIYASLRN